jgi:hypothetical protein
MEELFTIITEVVALTEFATPDIRKSFMNLLKELESDLEAEGYEMGDETEKAIPQLREALDDYMQDKLVAAEAEDDIVTEQTNDNEVDETDDEPLQIEDEPEDDSDEDDLDELIEDLDNDEDEPNEGPENLQQRDVQG